MCWFWMILVFLGLVFCNLSASEGRHISSHHPTALVVGKVFCDVCHYHQDLSKASHFISGAIVAVECANSGKNSRFYQEVKTNMHGEFSVHLPFNVDKHVKHVIGCSARLISSSEPQCAEASTTTTSSFQLKSKKKGTHIFSAGFFTFKPVNQPKLCNQKPSIHSTNNKEAYPDPILTPSVSRFVTINQGYLPPLPGLPPLPRLPPLPPLVLFPPLFHGPPMSLPPSTFPPFFHAPPMSPPPSTFPPFFHAPPIPPPSTFPPNFHSPIMSPPPSIPPPITPPPTFDLIPLPPPPSPPSQFLLPPFPFSPMPGLPGVPPASTSSSKKNSP
ncbi:hypothetical protein H5410_014670 [Solanum commersonii]|uniref:Uncharacterized protein n=1 Tax=Solanum commersonii TaxID=4109 RepID=A0A9J5ZRL4_SOLCO|nr:hypothetical protein H5410_014670 [Solanum commersonii]